MNNPVRVDKWLWAVRVFQTRTVAAEACRSGHVRVNGQPTKPSRELRIGDFIIARTEHVVRNLKVLALLEKRVGAACVPDYCQDLVPPEPVTRPPSKESMPPAWRRPGSGRPTKRDRRQIDAWIDDAAPPA